MTSTNAAMRLGEPLEVELEARQDRLRPPHVVMDPEVLGAARLTRYSFNRTLLRVANRRHWRVTRVMQDLDPEGRGASQYRVVADGHVFTFVALTSTLDERLHTDRVIAERWEIAAALVEGDVDGDFLAELRSTLPDQEGGRFDARTLVLTRGNRSVRFFDYLVNRLAAGRQPDPAAVADSGYIMRSTAFYGNGKFGMRSFDGYPEDHPLRAPYRAQFLAAWLFRELSYDLVEHCARARGGADAVDFDPQWRTFFGLGNATGLGLVPYAFQHPEVLHAWAGVREIALADVRSTAGDPELSARLRWWIERAAAHVATGTSEGAAPFLSPQELIPVVDRILAEWDRVAAEPLPFDRLYRWAELDGPETAELVVSLLIELHDADDELMDTLLRVDESAAIDPTLTVGELRALIARQFGWIDDLALDTADADAYWWVISDNTEEPRRAARTRLAPEERDVPIDIALRVERLRSALGSTAESVAIGDFLRDAPEHLLAVLRVTSSNKAYGEPRDNACSTEFLPLQLQRFQLAFYGMDNFKPKSTDWLRVTLFQGAPRVDDLGTDAMHDRWVLPPRPAEVLS